MLKWFHRIFWQPINNENGNTIGQAILGVVGLAVTFIPGVNIAWYLGLGIGLTLGGILFPPDIESPKTEHSNLQFQTSQYGIPIPVVYGSRKLAGNLIWYGDFQTHEHEEEAGGKGGGGSSYTTYTYSVGLAFGVCMAPLGDRKNIINVWAGKDLVDPSKYRVYDGSQTTADSYIAGFTTRDPVWKNLCYIVFEDYDLGNSSMIPNFTFEIGTIQDFERIGNITLNTNENKIRTAVIDEVNGFAYYGLYTIPGKIIKVQLSDFTRVGIITGVVGEDEFMSSVIDTTNGFAYFGTNTSPGQIVKIRLSDFTVVGTLPLNAGEDYLTSAVIDTTNGFAYFGTNTIPGQVIKIKLSDFTRDDALTLNTGEDTLYRGAIIDISGGFAYFGTYTSPGQIIKIKLSDFTRDDALTLPSSEELLYSATIDTVNGFAYFGTETQPAYVVKIRLSDFVRMGSLVTAITETSIYGMVTDTNNGYLYFSTAGGTLNKRVIQVRLSDFTRITNADFISTETYPGCGAIIDIINNIAYFGTEDSPAKIVKFELYTTSTSDVTPPTVSNDILTNDLYGLGLDPAYLDTAIFTATGAYCTTNDLLVSMIFDRQISVLDALQYIIQHHNGYITYFDGLIAHNQLETEVPVATLTTDYIVQEGDKYPVQIVKAGGRDYNNKIMVQWTKRANDYVTGIAQVDDMLDIETYGLKDATVPLDGLCTHSRASKMANLLLKKSLKNPESLTFKIGPKSIGLKPGDVYAITDAGVELNAKGIRIQTISETNDYQIEVNAKEELDTYTYLQTGDDTTTPPTLPNLSGDPGNVLTPMAIEVPALYSGSKCQVSINYSKSGDTSWAGASLYKAYSATGSYIAIGSRTGSGITGRISAIGETGADRYIDVILNWDATLISATSFDDLMTTPMKNLMVVETTAGDIYLRYQTVTLIGTNTWRLIGLIYDLTGTPLLNTYGVIIVNDDIAIYNNVNFLLDLEEVDKYKTIYFKVPSYNFKGEEESLAAITAINEVIDALCDKPLPPFDFKLNDEIGLHSTSASIKAGDIKVDWISANRFNTGAPDFDRFGVVTEDADFKDFLIEIYNSTTLKRSTTSTAKTYTYSTTDQTSDSAVSPFIFKIKQRSLSYVESTYDAITITTV